MDLSLGHQHVTLRRPATMLTCGHRDFEDVLCLQASSKKSARLRKSSTAARTGGATVNWTALSSGVVDKLFLYYAPKILGEGAVPFAASGGAPGSHGMLLAHGLELHQFGEDFAVEGYLKDPYQG